MNSSDEASAARPAPSSRPLFVACDIGTGSVRAAVFSADGSKQTSTHIYEIKTRNSRQDHFEQASDDIWRSVVFAIRAACTELGEDNSSHVSGIAFDATCSLVAINAHSGAPLSVVEGAAQDDGLDGIVYNVVLWCDHRSIPEANHINNVTAPSVEAVRKHFGGKLSAENEPPKLAHLSKHMRDFNEAAFFDLADWCTFKCIGGSPLDCPRSSCTVACKWGWGPSEGAFWIPDFWREIGLGELVDETTGNVSPRIGPNVVPPGHCVGTLCQSVADELGLPGTVRVASPMIDAHCGALAMLNPRGHALEVAAPQVSNRLAMICGTSTCHIAVTNEPLFVDGVWGPFRNAVLPGMWCAEGGQSATGALIDDIVNRSSASVALKERADKSGRSVYAVIEEIAEGLDTHECHVLPYFHGNRSPRADPSLRGVITGVCLAPGAQAETELARLFKSALEALALGARHIVREMNANGHSLSAIVACGGLTKSDMFMQILADACALPVFTTVEEDSVLSGGAILAASAMAGQSPESKEASGLCEALLHQMSAISEREFLPRSPKVAYYEKKFEVFLAMYEHQLEYREIMGKV